MNLFVADIGNTQTSAGVWNGSVISKIKTTSTIKLKDTFFPTNIPLAASSVVPSAESKFAQKKILWINACLDTGIDFSLIDIKTIGADRVAAAAAVAKFAKLPAIIVDAGTAVTIDAVNGGGKFFGGAILPGRAMTRKALACGTAKLPEIKISIADSSERFAGTNTKQAIISGTNNGFIGAVKYLSVKMADECGFRKYSLIITGGDSKLLLDNMPEGIHIDHLTLLGIAAIWERENNDSKNLRSKNKR